MCATNLPVKLSFDKNPLSFEKKVLDFSENSRTFVGRVVEFWQKDVIQLSKVFLGGNAMIPYPAITLNVPFILSFRKFGVEFSFLVEFFSLEF